MSIRLLAQLFHLALYLIVCSKIRTKLFHSLFKRYHLIYLFPLQLKMTFYFRVYLIIIATKNLILTHILQFFILTILLLIHVISVNLCSMFFNFIILIIEHPRFFILESNSLLYFHVDLLYPKVVSCFQLIFYFIESKID